MFPPYMSAIFTARRIRIAQTMPWQHVCPTARPSVYLTLRPSVIRQTSRPAHMYFCLLFCICMPVHLPIRHIHTHNFFQICLCFCIHMSVYHVHSYVSVCLSTTFMYTIRPFRTFLRLSVDLCVFVYVYIHANIYYMYSCLSVCLLHSCAILSIRVCVSSYPFV